MKHFANIEDYLVKGKKTITAAVSSQGIYSNVSRKTVLIAWG